MSNTTHHHPGKELADRLTNWLTDGTPAPESAQSKCDRVKAARETASVDTESVRILIKNQFGRTSPKQLTSEQCDQLIEMITQR